MCRSFNPPSRRIHGNGRLRIWPLKRGKPITCVDMAEKPARFRGRETTGKLTIKSGVNRRIHAVIFVRKI